MIAKILLAAIAILTPLTLCGCGGGKTAVETVKRTPIGGSIVGITWGSAVEAVSTEPAVWSKEDLPKSDPDRDTHFGVRAKLVRGKKEGFVFFKVAKDGSSVVPTALGSGGKVEQDDPGKIAEIFTMAMLLGGGTSEGISAAQVTAVEIKNRSILQKHAFWAFEAAMDADNRFPKDLAGVRSGAKEGDDLTLTDPSTGKGGFDPIYFSGLKLDPGKKSILLASPFPNADGTRTVVYTTTVFEKLTEEIYSAKVKEQRD